MENKNFQGDYNKLSTNFQKKLINMALMITIISFLIELIYLPLCYFGKMIIVPIPQYIYTFIIRPTILCLIGYFIAKYLYDKNEGNEYKQKIIPINLFVFICLNLVMTHAIFSCLYPIYIIPILLTIIYGDISITRKIFVNTLWISFIGFSLMFLDTTIVVPQRYFFSVILCYVLIFCSYFIARTIIKYEKSKEKILIDSFMENIQLIDKVNHDGLTNLYNYNAFINLLENELKKEQENTHVAILDIDFFKKVNDTYGHEAGNVVLCKFAELLKSYESENIKPARYGGEEFILMFNGLLTNDVYRIVESIRKDISKISFKELNDKGITLSAGITKAQSKLETKELIEKADNALYMSKNNGRNQTTIL